ncbi:RluA family pseudouridine synthase [Maricaulis sp.]|uniref:RluA family pseudouridine synthase n=1 Tax=Maricaulis sp. TaxID=1486257 RepID=UPI0026115B51|nr:RluA family pseudouridine synthase [Maricaulis sp.]
MSVDENTDPGPRAFVYDPPPAGPLPVIHADDHILVLDKPSGLLTVRGKPEAHADCLEARAREVYADARIVHRLDMDTSGVIIMARNAEAHRHLGLQFEKRQTRKTYQALVSGAMSADTGEVEAPLITDWPNRPKQMIDHERGKAALTRWWVLERAAAQTRVALAPMTGRSHQLRVHMLSLGHPILGDNLYADDAALAASTRLCLHACRLELRHPVGGEAMVFESTVPF